MATKILDVDLIHPLGDLTGLAPYPSAQVLVRWRGTPLGRMFLPIVGGRIAGRDLWHAVSQELRDALSVPACDGGAG